MSSKLVSRMWSVVRRFGAIFNDLEQLLIQISRSRQYWTLNMSLTIQYGHLLLICDTIHFLFFIFLLNVRCHGCHPKRTESFISASANWSIVTRFFFWLLISKQHQWLTLIGLICERLKQIRFGLWLWRKVFKSEKIGWYWQWFIAYDCSDISVLPVWADYFRLRLWTYKRRMDTCVRYNSAVQICIALLWRHPIVYRIAD